jgi:hypothetical protein
VPEWAHAFARRGRIVKMDNRDSDFILDLRFFNSLLVVYFDSLTFSDVSNIDQQPWTRENILSQYRWSHFS